jgi:hypothetical protein
MFSNHINRSRSGFIVGAIAALLFAQSSPLTVVPSTGKVGVNNTNPQSTLDVRGNANVSGNANVTGTVNVGSTVTATGFIGDGSQLTGLPTGGGGSETGGSGSI